MCNNMYENRTREGESTVKELDHRFDIMTVYRTHIHDSHLFKEHTGNEELLDATLGTTDSGNDLIAVNRNLL